VLYLVSLREQRTSFSLAQLYRSCTDLVPSCTDLVPKGGNPQLLVNTLAVVIEKLESSMATRAEPPDCRDSNPESRRTSRRARFLIAVKVDEANAAPPLSF
jgi:hypothetical protein